MRQDGLVEQLIETQKENQWTDGEFAERLGISRPFWVRIKLGNRVPGKKFLRAVIREFPGLMPEALKYLQGEE